MSNNDNNNFFCLGERANKRLSSSESFMLLPKSPIKSPTVIPRAFANGSTLLTFEESSPFTH